MKTNLNHFIAQLAFFLFRFPVTVISTTAQALDLSISLSPSPFTPMFFILPLINLYHIFPFCGLLCKKIQSDPVLCQHFFQTPKKMAACSL